MVYNTSKLRAMYAYEPLIRTLRDYDRWVRHESTESLGSIGDLRAVIPLIVILKDPDQSVRWTAAEALGEIGDHRAIGPLVTALNDQFTDVKENVISALIKIGDQRAIPGLLSSLQDWDVRKQAAEALNKLGWKPESINDTIHLLIANNELNKLKQMWEDTKRVLLTDIGSNNYMKVENALFTFISLGRQDIIPDLIRVLNNKGTKNTAEIYLNCGNSQLEAAAMTWAKRHGYHITSLPGSGPVKWGNW